MPSTYFNSYHERASDGLRRISKASCMTTLYSQALARKVRCDAQRPTCGNCAKTKRECLGYGVQLSWPRDGDKKRVVVSSDGDGDGDARRRQRGSDVRARFVNVRSFNVALALAVELENGVDNWKSILQVAGAVSYCLRVG